MHRVEAGQTLWRISRAYGVPLETLLAENAIDDPADLSEGTLLFVPGATHTVAVPAAGDLPQARVEQRPRRGPSSIPRAGLHALDPAARGEALAWPAHGVLISGFGRRERDRHEGIDLACPEGTPIRAADDGVVLFAGEQRGYGNIVLIAHDNDLVTVYAHNSENLVSRGDRVERGSEIARVGPIARQGRKIAAKFWSAGLGPEFFAREAVICRCKAPLFSAANALYDDKARI